MSLLPSGSIFANRFEIDRAAGAGGMGTVYRAVDRYSGDPVALKLLSTPAASSGATGEAQRFTREAELLAELRHPGIVSYVAHGQTPDGQCFLAMEWLDGQDLAQRLIRGPLPLLDALALMQRIAQGLNLAHRRGILHRDLKPAEDPTERGPRRAVPRLAECWRITDCGAEFRFGMSARNADAPVIGHALASQPLASAGAITLALASGRPAPYDDAHPCRRENAHSTRPGGFGGAGRAA